MLPCDITSLVTDVSVIVDDNADTVSLSVTKMTQASGCWKETTELIDVLSPDLIANLLKSFPPGSTETLPDFNGVITVDTLNEDGSIGTVDVIGGSVSPSNMLGSLLFINGAMHYINNTPPPEAIHTGPTAPTNPDTSLWVSNNIVKTKNASGFWVQNTPFGA
jgi:hypothetical protein